jgi:hypothetical protein
MVQPAVLALLLAAALVTACGSEPTEPAATATADASEVCLIDPTVLADVLGEAASIRGDKGSVDGLLVRLAFEPLIRQTGPVSLQLVQGQGYRLLGVAEGAPLWQLGLREGDVLMTVDRKPILGREHELRSHWEGRPWAFKIGYLRDSEARTLSLTVRPGGAWRAPDLSQQLVDNPDLPDLPDHPGSPDLSGRAGSPDLLDPFAQPELPAGIRFVPGDTADSFGRCEIERATFERLRADPANLAKQMRIVPTPPDAVTPGIKLYGIRRTSVASQIGLLNGDLIVGVDGQPLTTLDSALTAFTALTETGTLDLMIDRRGVTKQLTIAIVDTLN